VLATYHTWSKPEIDPCGIESDRGCAMDSSPPDEPGLPGGNGQLTYADVILTYNRWRFPDLTPPWRSLCDCCARDDGAAQSVALAPAAGARGAAQVPALLIGDCNGLAGDDVRLPVGIDLMDQRADRLAFSLELLPEGETDLMPEVVAFIAAPGLPDPVLIHIPGGGVGVAWLEALDAPVSGEVGLGELVIGLPRDAAIGDRWRAHVLAVGAMLGDEDVSPAVQAPDDALATVVPWP
jgi:hypothetical protein